MKKIFLVLFGLLFLSQAHAINAYQGKVFTITLNSIEANSQVKCEFINRKYSFYKTGDDRWQVIIGVPIEQKPGKYLADVIITSDQGKEKHIQKSVSIFKTQFPFSSYWLKPSRNKLRAKEIVNNEWADIEAVLLNEENQARWFDRFDLPAKAEISQGFGYRQIINNKPSGSHRGVDIAVSTGTPIHAANNGKVVFAKKLQAFGNTMVIDHGAGVHTLYFHLSKFTQDVGSFVKKGDIIALSGNTGVSSGPHLHWGMSVHNLRVDPMQWVGREVAETPQ